jgi:hypothetical protein
MSESLLELMAMDPPPSGPERSGADPPASCARQHPVVDSAPGGRSTDAARGRGFGFGAAVR